MASPLDSIAGKVGNAFSGIFYDAVLTRSIDTAGPNAWTPGTPTVTTFTCKAIHEEWGARHLAGSLVVAGDRKILILAATLGTQPHPGDRITLKGETFTVVPGDTAGQPAVSTDPAKATWTLRARA